MINKNFGKNDGAWFWGCSLAAVCAVYVYFFLILPQSWTLNNDYGWYSEWIGRRASFLQEAFNLNAADYPQGRFHPVWNYFISLQYSFLPVTPLYFRAVKMVLALVALVSFADFLKSLRFARSQILLALVLFDANLTMKDWITLTAGFEALATVFFLVSLSLYGRQKKALSIVFFVLCILSKESFFALVPTFLFLEYCEYTERKNGMRLFFKDWLVLAGFTLPCIAFVVFVMSLPRGYTGGHFKSFPVTAILRGLTLPPLRCFGPAFILVAYGFWRNRGLKIKLDFLKAVGTGFCIIIPISVLLVGWGPYDSWSYQAVAIPIGWAMILSTFWTDEILSDLKGLVLAAGTAVFLLLSTLNGSNNVWTFLSNGRTAAEIACEDHQRVPDLQVYTNCEEGAFELSTYLKVYDICPNPPKLAFAPGGTLPENTRKPYEVLAASHWCVPFDFNIPQTHRVNLRFWTILKNF